MECKQFKDFAKEMVDYIGDYLENIRDRYVRLYVFFMHTFVPSAIFCPSIDVFVTENLKIFIILSN
jgi:hypothetical protein